MSLLKVILLGELMADVAYDVPYDPIYLSHMMPAQRGHSRSARSSPLGYSDAFSPLQGSAPGVHFYFPGSVF